MEDDLIDISPDWTVLERETLATKVRENVEWYQSQPEPIYSEYRINLLTRWLKMLENGSKEDLESERVRMTYMRYIKQSPAVLERLRAGRSS